MGKNMTDYSHSSSDEIKRYMGKYILAELGGKQLGSFKKIDALKKGSLVAVVTAANGIYCFEIQDGKYWKSSRSSRVGNRNGIGFSTDCLVKSITFEKREAGGEKKIKDLTEITREAQPIKMEKLDVKESYLIERLPE
jgi:hypothetical protein